MSCLSKNGYASPPVCGEESHQSVKPVAAKSSFIAILIVPYDIGRSASEAIFVNFSLPIKDHIKARTVACDTKLCNVCPFPIDCNVVCLDTFPEEYQIWVSVLLIICKVAEQDLLARARSRQGVHIWRILCVSELK